MTPLSYVVRMLVTLATATIGVRVADALIGGFSVDGHDWLFAGAIALVAAIAAPLSVRFALPLFVYTAGLMSLVINAGAVGLVASLATSVHLADFWSALGVALIMTAIALATGWLLALDDDATFERAVMRRQVRQAHRVPKRHGPIYRAIASFYAPRTARRATLTVPDAPPLPVPQTPGVIFLEIDGCSHGVLQRAMRAGYTPNLARWLRTGTHAMHRWRTDLSSQTGAGQAGLLLGSNRGIVAFRWYERDRQEIVVTSRPSDAARIEHRLSSGRGLLAGGGASRNNLVTGDASTSMMTLSTALETRAVSSHWRTFFSHSDNVARTLIRSIADVAREIAWTVRLRRRRVWPRLHKSWKYPFLRATTTVVMPDITVDTLIADMVRGVPSAYATFVGYDEVAHHDGVERPAALEQLRALDRAFHRIEIARRYAARPYEIVVLSDHGQSQGATFRQRYGETLEELVRRLVGVGHAVAANTASLETASHLRNALVGTSPGFAERAEWLATGTLAAEEEEGHAAAIAADVGEEDVLVLASGNLGLVYLLRHDTRATYEQMEAECPGLVDDLASHPGVGFVLVCTESRGSVAIGADGRHWVHSGAVEGIDPLEPYGPGTVEVVRRHDTFKHVPDLLVMGTWYSDTDEVAAFEELIGSHGGMGGEQNWPFVLAPRNLPWPDTLVVGAGAVHRVFKGWLRRLSRMTPPLGP